MKKIEAIIRYAKFEEVKDALAEIGIQFFTFEEVKGFGLQKGSKVMYRGHSYGPDYIARVKLVILVEDAIEQKAVDTIIAAAATGEIGDGKITVSSVDKVYRIRNGEMNEKAL